MKKVVFLLLGLISLNAFAVDPTQGPLQQDPSLCSYGYNPNCNNRGSSNAQTIIRYREVPPKYGALAFNAKQGAIGGALNMDSKAEAKKAALERCEKNGLYKPCKIIATVKNGCIAAVTGKLKSGGSKIFRAIEELGQAEQAALKQCNASGASNCKIVMPEGCSIPDVSKY